MDINVKYYNFFIIPLPRLYIKVKLKVKYKIYSLILLENSNPVQINGDMYNQNLIHNIL
jgi:hypothetical protein